MVADLKRLVSLVGFKARPLRLIEREYGRKVIYGALGQRIHCFCFGAWSVSIWRMHRAETSDPRFCTEKRS